MEDHYYAKHVKEPRFSCEICGKTFKWKRALRRHKSMYVCQVSAKPVL